MGYMHIDNLYKTEAQKILEFKWVYALEKLHGTSSNLKYIKDLQGERIVFFSGGMKHQLFVDIFDHDALLEKFRATGLDHVTIYGEAYGGAQQGMSAIYGKDPKFCAFDVLIGESTWLSVPEAAKFVEDFGLEFVWYTTVETKIEEIDKIRQMPSHQAERNGMGNDKWSEGIVLRPPFEVTLNKGKRVMAKHKNEMYHERNKQPSLQDAIKNKEKLVVLQRAKEIADEWVTEMRLTHVLDKIEGEHDVSRMGEIIKAMQEDVVREAEGEIVVSKDALGQIARATAEMFKRRMKMKLGSM